jgi:hypothetical protein
MELLNCDNNYQLGVLGIEYSDIFGFVVEKTFIFNNKIGMMKVNNRTKIYIIKWNNDSLNAEIHIDNMSNSKSNFDKDNEVDYNLAKGLCMLLDINIESFPFK